MIPSNIKTVMASRKSAQIPAGKNKKIKRNLARLVFLNKSYICYRAIQEESYAKI